MFQTLWISSSHGIRGFEGSLVSDVLFIDILMEVLVLKKNHIFYDFLPSRIGNGFVEDHYATRYLTVSHQFINSIKISYIKIWQTNNNTTPTAAALV